MEIYLVGGAVRDELLGLPVGERDWVVVGSTPEAMLRLGYRQVGRDFPVFLHPETGEEYALARTERKTGPGHTGFICHAGPEVTLQDDLLRRDLTINAMARGPSGDLVDPYGGRADLEARRLRHVSTAFAEDPLRVFRVARFAAQLPGFGVAPETLDLMRAIAARDQLAELSAERVWQELAKALACAQPRRFFEVVRDARAFAPWLVELAGSFALLPAGLDGALDRFVALAWPLPPEAVTTLCGRLRAPREYERLGCHVARFGALLGAWRERPPEALYDALKSMGAFRKNSGLGPVWRAVTACSGVDVQPLAALAEALRDEVTAASLQRPELSGVALGQAIDAARIARLAAVQVDLARS